jgi:hypothetical protein
MEQEKSIIPPRMLRRWIYMSIAIIAAALLGTRPVFNFQSDTGILYTRSFSMEDQKQFVVTQRELSTGAEEVAAIMSVKGLYYCSKAMLWGSILCLLCFFSYRGRMTLIFVTVAAAGLFYILMIVYAIRMTDQHYATLYPNFAAIWPAIVLQAMLLTRSNMIREKIDEADEETSL